MAEKKVIHIVSFNVPYPPNYGGIIDVFYKILALHNIGIQVILHCFDYGRGHQAALETFCEKVYYYKRKTGLLKSISKLPYIVKSRSNTELINNLLTDNYPILFEGLHTTFYLKELSKFNRKLVVRTHNIEHDYYNYLAIQEGNILRKQYFKNAAIKLKNYESILNNATSIAAISPNDYKYFANKYNKTFWLPPFHPNNKITIKLGKGNYAIYHGNLSVPENIKAAQFVIDAFSKTKINIVIAGRNPDKRLINDTMHLKHIKIVANPTSSEMNKLVEEAQLQLLPTFQPTGIKLKLIASLFSGKHCLVNDDMINGTGLEKLCHRANTKEQFVQQAEKLMTIPFEDQDLITRKEVLCKKFDNMRNAELLADQIFGS